ncbi:MAG: amylo-alpha-1,6-glucosidase [Pseudomonadota bacterium]|nr:amylo-alpha-1,6-glucosidase [Pseudomonadota bacterium]
MAADQCHTVGATLWHFHAISRYVETTADLALPGSLFPVLQSIVQHHIQVTSSSH